MNSTWDEHFTRTRMLLASSGTGGRRKRVRRPREGGAPALRILMLHGLGQDEAGFREATAALRAAAQDSVEFVLCRAPHEAASLSMLLGSGVGGGKGMQWWNMSPSSLGAGWLQSLDHLVEILEQSGPFDGVIGFSQGSAALAMLSAEAHLQGKQSWFRFACFVGGFLPNAPHMRERIDRALKSGPLDMPTWHCFGRNDFVIPPEKSQALAHCFVDAVQRLHEGGHSIPSNKIIQKSFREFLEARIKENLED